MVNASKPGLMAIMLSTLLSFSATAPAGHPGDNAVHVHDASHGKPRAAVQIGPRPYWLIEDMDEDNARSRQLKRQLRQCADMKFKRTGFSIGHRGAPLQFPEHTVESYVAAARMGAGIVECDVTFTRDKHLVCRHAQCDLHQTTNILRVPELRAKCNTPPQFDANGKIINSAQVKCCTSDLTLAQFKTLEGKMDARRTSPDPISIDDYMNATAPWRTDLYATKGTLMTHAESIALFQRLGVKMTPELKEADDSSLWVDIDGDGAGDNGHFDTDGDGVVDYTQAQYAQQMIDEYITAGVSPGDVYAQSFNIDDVLYWIANAPGFGRQAVWLDGRYADPAFDHTDPATWVPNMRQIRRMGVNIIAPPMWMLVREGRDGNIHPSIYARRARLAGLDIITWTFERSAPVLDGQWYHQTTDNLVGNSGDKMLTLDVLARDVGILGIFSDWAAPVTYYANCMRIR